jgi:hypothetical protein
MAVLRPLKSWEPLPFQPVRAFENYSRARPKIQTAKSQTNCCEFAFIAHPTTADSKGVMHTPSIEGRRTVSIVNDSSIRDFRGHLKRCEPRNHRTSISLSPRLNLVLISGINGSSQAKRTRFVQLPIRSQTTTGAAGLPRHRSTKSSSFVIIAHSPLTAKFQMVPSSESRRPRVLAGVADIPNWPSHVARAGGNCASTRKRIFFRQPRAPRDLNSAKRRR